MNKFLASEKKTLASIYNAKNEIFKVYFSNMVFKLVIDRSLI
ncbi:hypothetical protein DFN06_000288 [Clostridium beijerinckii]|jgi:hypothetical protein|nr:hypothetical protein [Clostridium beijerinckii]NOV70222.1 hypothetical protein [Clostridium beijerinckii]NOW30870.1 hypothetical protein [Clostridium beijerinckii]NOW86561.1 hypothetical protein [Clostridium beijerinckii]NRZ24572.1 hypothetical protein [Clostridium beijerinckii]